jgi:hypothetical protein
MTRKKQIQPDDKIGLKLTQAERKLLLDGLNMLPKEHQQAIKGTPVNEPVMLTLDDLDDLGGYVAAEVNHCDDKKKQKKLDTVFQKIQRLIETHSDEAPPRTLRFEDAKQVKQVAGMASALADWAAQILMIAKKPGMKSKSFDHFPVAPAYRKVLLQVSSHSKSIKSKLSNKRSAFTLSEIGGIVTAIAKDLPKADAQTEKALFLVATSLMDGVKGALVKPAESKERKRQTTKTKTDAKHIYQFKIMLKDTKPPIWRRIQVQDCTLDTLHEHIQTAMGWTNSHLHQFEVGGKRYGNPKLLGKSFEDAEFIDSTHTKISKIVPINSTQFRFIYEYDFGDGWAHDVLFEGSPRPEQGNKYPLCLEGGRACPPEDVGGVWGYIEFLEALADPKHEQHDEFLEWVGTFDPDQFDAKAATKAMNASLPDWTD